jgi:hypothetical protein
MYRLLKWAVLPALLALVSSCDPAQNSVQNPPTAPLFSEEVTGHTLVEGQVPDSAPELQISELIGPGGGSIHLEGHSLTVPEGAVEEPTVFTMTLRSDGYVGVDLSAVVGDIVDVGANGFPDGKEVTLSLTYAWASNVTDPSKLKIVQLLDDGTVDPLESKVQGAEKTVTAKLKHFSKYCLASN